jgi:hypothetical protein
METVLVNEFSLILTGVVIFTVQRLISDLWISPNIEFQKCLGRLETLLIRYEFLCGYEFGSNNGTNDGDVVFFKQEIKTIVTDLIGNFTALFFAEKWWLKHVRKINIHQTKPQLLILSDTISTRKDVIKEEPRAEKAIENIRKNLKFKTFEIDYGKI